MLHVEEHVVLAAHVAEAEVQRGGVGRGRQHRLRHDAWDVQFLPTFSRSLFRSWLVILLVLRFIFTIATALFFSFGPLPVLPNLTLSCVLFLVKVGCETGLPPGVLQHISCKNSIIYYKSIS